MDNYLGFRFGDLRVSLDADGVNEFKGFILNSGEDLQFSNTPSFSDDFIEMKFGVHSILTGTTLMNREFNFSVVLDNINLINYRKFLKLLDIKKEDKLVFDYNDDYYYKVKLAEISPSRVTPTNSGNYIIELDLTFVTVEDWAAIWNKNIQDYHSTIIESGIIESDHVNISTVQDGSSDIIIKNLSTLEHYYIFEIVFNNQGSIKLSETTPERVFLHAEGNSTIKYFSRYGLALDNDSNFAEVINSDIFYTSEDTTINIEANNVDSIKIYPIIRERI